MILFDVKSVLPKDINKDYLKNQQVIEGNYLFLSPYNLQ